MHPNNTASKLWIAGFGIFTKNPHDDNGVPKILQHSELNFVGHEKCLNYWDSYYINNIEIIWPIDDHYLCATTPTSTACYGDSGGPVYDRDNNLLVGTTVATSVKEHETIPGHFYCSTDFPDLYSRVSSYVSYHFLKFLPRHISMI